MTPYKCTFYGINEIIDSDFKQRAKRVVKKLVSEHDNIEFWFYCSGNSYDAFLSEVLNVKRHYADKKISIVKMMLPDWNPEWERRKRYNKILPFENFDKISCADTYSSDSLTSSSELYLMNYYQVQFKLLEQCDAVIIYSYQELFFPENIYIKRLITKGKNKIISLSSSETSQKIIMLTSELDDRKKFIMEQLLQKVRLRVITRKLGISKLLTKREAYQASMIICMKSRVKDEV